MPRPIPRAVGFIISDTNYSHQSMVVHDVDEVSERLQSISGTIVKLSCTRRHANFVFSGNDKAALGIIAVAASLTTNSGLAASTAATANVQEEADYLDFLLNGKIVRGWVWRSPFKEGDQVDVVAQWQGSHYEAFAIARPIDRIVALYPHCSRGRLRHWLTVLKWWLIGCTILMVFGAVGLLCFGLISGRPWAKIWGDIAFLVPASSQLIFPFFLVAAVSMGWKWMSFVRLAEQIFIAFEWDRPSCIDLKKSSREGRTASGSLDCGVFYFRY